MIKTVLQTFKIPSSTYYERINRKPDRYACANNSVFMLIYPEIIASNFTYGSERLSIYLDTTHGMTVSRQRISKIMKAHGIVVVVDPRRPYQTYGQVAGDDVCPNLLEQDFTTTSKNQKWVSDITYIKTTEHGWTYLASVLDLHTNKIVGWAYEKRMTTNLVINALQNARLQQKYPTGVILHSDRGSQYTSDVYRKLVTQCGLNISFSRKGCPYDNACIESFHATIKKECIYRSKYGTFEDAKSSIFKYIEGWYNSRRIQVKFRMSPNQFESLCS